MACGRWGLDVLRGSDWARVFMWLVFVSIGELVGARFFVLIDWRVLIGRDW